MVSIMNRAVFLLALLAGLGGCPHASPPTPPPPVPDKVVDLNTAGELVDVEASFVPGYVVVVDFWAEWCGACKVMEAALMEAIADEPRVLVRKVDVGDGDTPVAAHYQIGPLPHLRVYDTHGELRYLLKSNDALEAGAKALQVLREDQAH
jgi:thiol-disulfide isomerase/thioredoxin